MSKLLCWLPAIALAIAIFIVSSLSHQDLPLDRFPHQDKAEHWLAYCGLAWLIAWALRRAHDLALPKTLALAVLIASAYGATDELHQRFVPTRTCDVRDWVADTLGAAAAVAIFFAYESYRSAKANR